MHLSIIPRQQEATGDKVKWEASEKELAAALSGEGQPVDFDSWPLTDTDTRSAQLEKEMPAIVFAADLIS